MQIAVSHETYPNPIGANFQAERTRFRTTRRKSRIGVDVCRLLIATLGLSLYVGLPVLTVAFLGNLFLG